MPGIGSPGFSCALSSFRRHVPRTLAHPVSSETPSVNQAPWSAAPNGGGFCSRNTACKLPKKSSKASFMSSSQDRVWYCCFLFITALDFLSNLAQGSLWKCFDRQNTQFEGLAFIPSRHMKYQRPALKIKMKWKMRERTLSFPLKPNNESKPFSYLDTCLPDFVLF